MTQVHLRIKDVVGRAPTRGDRLWVRADAVRSTAAGEVLAPVAVAIDLEGSPTVTLEPGPARVRFDLRDLAIHQNREFPVVVPTEGPITLRDLMQEAYDWTPDELSAFEQIRADATAAADRSATEADRAEAAAVGVEGAISAAATALALEVEGHRAVTEQAATDAAGSATAAAASATAAGLSETAAAGSASAAAGSATGASGSATAAAGSASAADGSATAAAGSATDAEQIRDQTVAAAQVVADNLSDITAAPGHAAAAQSARTGAETARDVAEEHVWDAAGSAAAAAGSASAADSSATAADGSAAAAAGSASDASTSATAAAGSATAAAGSETAAGGHADASAGSAAAASGSETVASQKADAAAGSAQDAADALAQVLVELANTKAYQDVLTAVGAMSADWQADIAAALADLVGQAPETLDSIHEIATALGNDPNFYTTVMAAIGQRVLNTDPRLSDARTPTAHDHTIVQVTGLGDALGGKSDVGHGHTWEQVTGKPGTFASTIALVGGLQDALDGKVTNHGGASGIQVVTTLPTTGVPGIIYFTEEA